MLPIKKRNQAKQATPDLRNRNLWNQPNVPHRGWQWHDSVDLKAQEGEDYTPHVCEMCGKENIRIVHTLRHEDYPTLLRVGRVCAQKMENDYISAGQRESRLANRTARRERWLIRKWKTSRQGNQFLNIAGRNVGVFPSKFARARWSYRISVDDGDAVFSSDTYESRDAAKLALFDRLAMMLDW